MSEIESEYDQYQEDLVMLADAIAEYAHRDQTDLAGQPYIEHPRRMAARLSHPFLKQVALLHDVVEDSHTTFQDLLDYGVSSDVVDLVRILSRIEGESYQDFIDRIAADRLAARVKIEDLIDNLDPDRGAFEIPDRLRRRYTRALRQLLLVVFP